MELLSEHLDIMNKLCHEELVTNFKKDSILKQFLTGDKDVDLEIMELSGKI